MSFSSSFLHLDGVEFKVSDSLQPPVIRPLPSDFRMKDPSTLLRESNYDFAKEKAVLTKIEAIREAERKMAEQENEMKQMSLKRRADAEKQRLEEMMAQQREVLQTQKELFLEQKRKQKEENENALQEESSSKEGSSAAISESSPTYENISLEHSLSSTTRNPFSQVGKDLLVPQPAASNAQDSASTSSHLNQSQPVVTGQNQIWVDFEDKELDPFTNMELKTLDDIAELQTVLQNANRADYLPSYEEVTSSSNAQSTVEVENNERSETPPVISRNSSPEGPQNAELMPRSTSEMTGEDTPMPSHSADLKQPSLNGGGSYENVHLEKVYDIAAEMSTPASRPLKTRNAESLYDFADGSKPISESGETANVARMPPENSPDDDAALYTVVRPKIRAQTTSPDLLASASNQSRPVVSGFQPASTSFVQSPVITGSIQPKLVPTSFGQSNPFAPNYGLSNPVPTGYIQSQSPVLNQSAVPEKINPVRSTRYRPDTAELSVQGQTSPVVTPTSHVNPAVPTKVLPITFGGVTNSLSSPALPPVASTLQNGMSHVVSNPGSSSNPNLTRPPIPAPRRPPLLPRDPAVSLSPPLPSRSQPDISHSPQINPAPPSQSHLLPPYALPQPNGPASSSSATAFFHQPSPPLAKKVVSAPSSGTNVSFIQKSHEDRAKFAATVNKALSSLPQNPKPVVKHKPTVPHGSTSQAKAKSQAFSNYKPLPPMSRSLSLKSSLVAGLSPEEQEFVNNVTSMGFDLEATIRATQKCGLSGKEVVDHLCRVQKIVEQGFSTRMVQDALEMFENDNKMVSKYLQQASQLMDMGFKEDDVREALKSSSNDQTKALDQLMGQS